MDNSAKEKLTMEEFLENSPRDFSDSEKEIIERAFYFSKNAHENQKRKNGEPYFVHSFHTAKNLLEWKLDHETIAAGFLHDVVEDTDKKLEDIRKEFGENISFLVDGITKLSKVRFQGNEQERYIENLRKMFLVMAEDIRVVLIKLADRLHNMRTLDALPADSRARIAKETLEIYAPLAYRLGMGELKGILEDLCFPYIYPKEYEELMNGIGEKFKETEGYLLRARPIVEAELIKEGIKPVSIHARGKHIYSLWKKLFTEEVGGDIDKVYDLAAMRVILKDTDDCYHALGIIHQNWKPLPGKIKDYIAMPKPNGYQSIHTTVFGPEGKIIEIQIRTQKMHDEAENGIAAHWAYSEQGKPEAGVVVKSKSLDWVRQLKDWQSTISSPENFVDRLKIDVFKNRIFAFTPTGDVIDLPEGAIPIDFAYSVHTDIGNHCFGAKVNGKMVSLDTVLKNGDVVEIITAKNKKPSTGWLDIAKTANARSKIRVALGIGKKDHLG